MKAEVFEKDNITGLQLGAGLFGCRAGAIGDELDRFSEQFFQFRRDRLKGVFVHLLAVGTSEVAHQHDGSAVAEHVFDRRERGDNALVVGDRAGRFVLRDIEIHTDERAFAGEVEVAESSEFGHGFAGERNGARVAPGAVLLSLF